MDGPETRESLLASLNSPIADEGWLEFAAIYRPLIFRVAVAKGLQYADADDLAHRGLAPLDTNHPAIVDRRLEVLEQWRMNSSETSARITPFAGHVVTGELGDEHTGIRAQGRYEILAK